MEQQNKELKNVYAKTQVCIYKYIIGYVQGEDNVMEKNTSTQIFSLGQKALILIKLNNMQNDFDALEIEQHELRLDAIKKLEQEMTSLEAILAEKNGMVDNYGNLPSVSYIFVNLGCISFYYLWAIFLGQIHSLSFSAPLLF